MSQQPTHYAGEFHAKVPPSQPSTKKWHKPGNEQGNDAIPEFHATHHAPGTAPPESIFRPNPASEFPTQDQPFESASSTLPGATSRDVHTGLGLPLQGQEGRELHPQLPGKKSGAESERAHLRGNKKEGTGLVGVGANAGPDWVRSRGLDLPEGVEKGRKGKHTAEWPGAEERVPETAEAVAAEMK